MTIAAFARRRNAAASSVPMTAMKIATPPSIAVGLVCQRSALRLRHRARRRAMRADERRQSRGRKQCASGGEDGRRQKLLRHDARLGA